MKHASIFCNMVVGDIQKSRNFWESMGYYFNEEFCNEQALCLVLNEGSIYAMLLLPEFMETFMDGKLITESKKSSEMLIALSVEKKEDVDTLIEKALSLGATLHGKTYDYGFMYGRDFADLDGHIWELVWMDQKQQ